MHRKKKSTIFLLFLVVILCSCTVKVDSEEVTSSGVMPPEQSTPMEENTEVAKRVVAEKKASEIEAMAVYAQSEFDFLSGDTVGKITIYTGAERDSEGNILWNDGQLFALEVMDEEQYFYLIPPKYTQLGTLQYKVFQDLSNGDFVAIVETLTEAGVTATEYRYNTQENVFLEKMLYQYDNINHFQDSRGKL